MFDVEQSPKPTKSWNTGPKAPLKVKHIWEVRTRLTIDRHSRDLALLNLAIDSKLRGCNKLRLNDVIAGMAIRARSRTGCVSGSPAMVIGSFPAAAMRTGI